VVDDPRGRSGAHHAREPNVRDPDPAHQVLDEAWMRGHQVALPWTVAGRYVAGLFAVAALVAVGADREAPLGLVLGLGGIATVIAALLGAVLAIHRDARPDAGAGPTQQATASSRRRAGSTTSPPMPTPTSPSGDTPTFGRGGRWLTHR
jgi:hypothetical protein